MLKVTPKGKTKMDSSNNNIDVAPATPLKTEKHKKSTSSIVAVACAVLAVAGIGFGVYGMIGMNQSPSDLSDLKVQLADTDGNITTLETDKIEVSNDTDTITITDSSTPRKNPILPTDYTTHFATVPMALGTDAESSYELGIWLEDGEISSCKVSITDNTSTGESATKYCEITGLSGKIYKISQITTGLDGYSSQIAFIMEDGSVYYFPLEEAFENMDFSVKGKLKIDGVVSDTFEVAWVDSENSYVTTVFVLSDGTYVQYDESMLK